MSETPIQKDVVIVGGGISGLATAFRLQRAGVDVLLLENAPHVGGAIQTERAEGFIVDYGPNSALDTSPKIRDFLEQVGLMERRVDANPAARRRYVVRDGALVPLPMSPPQFLATRLFSWRAKLRLLREPFILPAPDDREETIAEFVRRRLGGEFLDYAINPFIAGVYAGDPERLSVRSAVAKIYALEKNYGSLIKGAIKGAKERKKRGHVDKTRAGLFSFRDGMAELPAALEKHLAGRVHTATTLEHWAPEEDGTGYRLTTVGGAGNRQIRTRALVFTTPAWVTADYVEARDATLAAALRDIIYPPVAVVFLGFKRVVPSRPLDGFGFLVPKVENRRILGTIWSSTIFPGHAPEGGLALTTFVGGMRQPELAHRDDAELVHLVLDDLRALMGLDGQPDLLRIRRWPRAIPQYELGHAAQVAKMEAFEARHPGVFISGNYRGGISVGDCILNSEAVAERVVAAVGADRPAVGVR